MASLNSSAINSGGDMAAKGKSAAEIVANKLKVPKIFDTEVGDARSERSEHLKSKSISIFFCTYYEISKTLQVACLINDGSDESNFKPTCLLTYI